MVLIRGGHHSTRKCNALVEHSRSNEHSKMISPGTTFLLEGGGVHKHRSGTVFCNRCPSPCLLCDLVLLMGVFYGCGCGSVCGWVGGGCSFVGGRGMFVHCPTCSNRPRGMPCQCGQASHSVTADHLEGAATPHLMWALPPWIYVARKAYPWAMSITYGHHGQRQTEVGEITISMPEPTRPDRDDTLQAQNISIGLRAHGV